MATASLNVGVHRKTEGGLSESLTAAGARQISHLASALLDPRRRLSKSYRLTLNRTATSTKTYFSFVLSFIPMKQRPDITVSGKHFCPIAMKSSQTSGKNSASDGLTGEIGRRPEVLTADALARRSLNVARARFGESCLAFLVRFDSAPVTLTPFQDSNRVWPCPQLSSVVSHSTVLVITNTDITKYRLSRSKYGPKLVTLHFSDVYSVYIESENAMLALMKKYMPRGLKLSR